MTVTELIEALTVLRDAHGDWNVVDMSGNDIVDVGADAHPEPDPVIYIDFIG
jgi:hypothetical protein